MEAERPAAPDAARQLLEVRGLSKSFRGLQALSDYELHLPTGSIHGVIGPNGAGKTTLFHLLSGFLRPSAGRIAFDGRDITGSPAYAYKNLSTPLTELYYDGRFQVVSQGAVNVSLARFRTAAAVSLRSSSWTSA